MNSDKMKLENRVGILWESYDSIWFRFLVARFKTDQSPDSDLSLNWLNRKGCTTVRLLLHWHAIWNITSSWENGAWWRSLYDWTGKDSMEYGAFSLFKKPTLFVTLTAGHEGTFLCSTPCNFMTLDFCTSSMKGQIIRVLFLSYRNQVKP